MMHWSLWYAVPLVLSISIVYGATRDERPSLIFAHAWRSALWIVGFMGICYAVMLWSGWGL
ncbi:MAG: hypothetical protein KDA83_20395 [Planctomycetales bacterium]|nr:hypothetical protein [Planctomycetales bacterium]